MHFHYVSEHSNIWPTSVKCSLVVIVTVRYCRKHHYNKPITVSVELNCVRSWIHSKLLVTIQF